MWLTDDVICDVAYVSFIVSNGIMCVTHNKYMQCSVTVYGVRLSTAWKKPHHRAQRLLVSIEQ